MTSIGEGAVAAVMMDTAAALGAYDGWPTMDTGKETMHSVADDEQDSFDAAAVVVELNAVVVAGDDGEDDWHALTWYLHLNDNLDVVTRSFLADAAGHTNEIVAVAAAVNDGGEDDFEMILGARYWHCCWD